MKLICEFCGRNFEPDSFNKHHQKYCTDSRCVKDRKRARQREWIHRMRRDDEGWRRLADKRSSDCHRRRREQDRADSEAKAKEDFEKDEEKRRIDAIVAGLIVYMGKSRTPAEFAKLSAQIERDGRKALGSTDASGSHSTAARSPGDGDVKRQPPGRNICMDAMRLRTKCDFSHSTVIGGHGAGKANSVRR